MYILLFPFVERVPTLPSSLTYRPIIIRNIYSSTNSSRYAAGQIQTFRMPGRLSVLWPDLVADCCDSNGHRTSDLAQVARESLNKHWSVWLLHLSDDQNWTQVNISEKQRYSHLACSPGIVQRCLTNNSCAQEPDTGLFIGCHRITRFDTQNFTTARRSGVG
jgi:hypothetical protein